MKKQIILIIVCFFSIIDIYSLDISKNNIILFLFKDKELVSIYSSFNKDSVVTKVFNNGEAGKLYAFNILEKKDSMIKVIGWSTINKKKIKGWIKITDTAINGRARTEKSIYELYDKPDYKSKKITVDSYWESYVITGKKRVKIYKNINENFRVFDISGEWLKVEIKSKDKVYRKWLPKEYQCPIVTGGCT
jgi:hypothetical protein